MARIIVAEDDPKQASILSAYLERDGHTVTFAPDGPSAVVAVHDDDPDLLLLDLMLPGADGFEVLRRIRPTHRVPVIMLTARGAEVDQLRGFDLGADDYVVKPYSPRQLAARIRAVLRRVVDEGAGDDVIVVGDIDIDRPRREVRVAGRVISTTPAEYALLSALAASPGQVHTRARLLEEISHGDRDALERVVDMHVSNLRRKVEDDPASPRRIVTVKGHGYRLEVTPARVP